MADRIARGAGEVGMLTIPSSTRGVSFGDQLQGFAEQKQDRTDRGGKSAGVLGDQVRIREVFTTRGFGKC